MRSPMNNPNLSRVRAAAGKLGGVARWANVEREPTVKIRVFVSDAARLKALPGTSAQAVRALLTAPPRKCYNTRRSGLSVSDGRSATGVN
jgi:hypothetical protein